MVEGPGRASRITSIPPTVDVTDVTDPQGVAVAEALRNSLHPPSSLRAEPQALVASPSDRLRGAPTHSSLVNGARSALLPVHPRFRKVSHPILCIFLNYLCPSLVITPYTTTTSISSNLGVAVFRVCALVGLDPCRPCRHADDGALRSGSFELVPRHDEPLVRLAMVSGIGQGVAEAVSEGTSASTRASVSQSVKQRGCTRSRWPVYRPYNCSAVGEQRQHGSIAGAS